MSSIKNTILKDVLFLVAEAAFIFISVYFAFVLNSHRIQRNHEHKRQQIYVALYHYFSAITPGLKKAYDKSDETFISPFLESYREKEMPRLKKAAYSRNYITDKTWNAILQSGGIELLNVKFITQVSAFFNENRIFNRETKHFQHMSVKFLLPNYNADISTFYNTNTKKLKPQYEWYINFVHNIRGSFGRMPVTANKILKMLKKKMNKKQLQKIEANSTDWGGGSFQQPVISYQI
jgi:hypothetical protein